MTATATTCETVGHIPRRGEEGTRLKYRFRNLRLNPETKPAERRHKKPSDFMAWFDTDSWS